MFENAFQEADQFNMESEDDFNSRIEEYESLSLTASDWTLETLFRQIEKNNIELSPAFQRRAVWDKKKKSQFIESLILGIPVPQIVLAQKQNERGKYIVLDGKQRLLSIAEFYCGQYKLSSLNLLSNLNDMNIESLEESYRDRFDNSTIRAVRLAGWESDSVLYTIFHRLNTGSVQLNTQELRSALSSGPFTSFALHFTESNYELSRLFSRNATGPDFRMRDIEMLTRYCGITRKATEYKGNLKAFLDETTKWLNGLDDSQSYEAYAEEALRSIKLFNQLYQQIAEMQNVASMPTFSLIQPDKGYRFNRAVFDSLCYPLQDPQVYAELSSQKIRMAPQLQKMLMSEEFVNACSSSTKTQKSLVMRIDLWSSLLSRELNISVKSLDYDGEKIRHVDRNNA